MFTGCLAVRFWCSNVYYSDPHYIHFLLILGKHSHMMSHLFGNINNFSERDKINIFFSTVSNEKRYNIEREKCSNICQNILGLHFVLKIVQFFPIKLFSVFFQQFQMWHRISFKLILFIFGNFFSSLSFHMVPPRAQHLWELIAHLHYCKLF